MIKITTLKIECDGTRCTMAFISLEDCDDEEEMREWDSLTFVLLNLDENRG